MTSVAVIGGGAAGIGASRALLAAGCEVALFEAAPGLGGNCHAVVVPTSAGGRCTIDAGVSDFNRATFPACVALFDELGLATQPIDTDASFATTAGRSVASCRAGRWQLEARFGDADAFAAEVAAFRERATEVLHGAAFAGCTVGEYLDHIAATRALRDVYVLPRAMGCFPSPDAPPASMSVQRLVEFWQVHGVVGAAAADRHTIVGGMHRYPPAFAAWFVRRGGNLQVGARVLAVVRHRRHVEIRYVDRDDRHRRCLASQVLFANHPRDVLPLLEAPALDERRALATFPSQRARVVVHQDARLLGHDRSTWGAFHYVVGGSELRSGRPTITFFPNRLARLGAEVPDVFVTLNPHREPRPETVLAERFLVHPVATVRHGQAAAAVEALQGRRRTWFAGSWLRRPFVHESALQSGMLAVRRLLGHGRDADSHSQVA